jgi:plasmid stabilization system protein ParE
MKSGYNIEWTSEAERNLSAIFDYLEANWAQREISNFAIQLEANLEYISEHPTAFPFYSEEKNVRRCVLSSQTTIYYTEVPFENRIVIITLFDNRRDIACLNI